MIEILFGVLANGFYDFLRGGVQRLRPQSRLSERLRELQWERLYEDTEVQRQIAQYRSQRSRETLIALGAAVQQKLNSDPGSAAGVQQLLESEADIEEVMCLALEENTRSEITEQVEQTQQTHTRSTSTERLGLIQRLNALPDQPFNMLILALNPPPGQVPPPTAAQGSRTYALLDWAEGTGGCGLDEVRQILVAITHSS